MKTPVWFLETHTSFFHPAGKNFGNKIYADKHSDIKVEYDSESGEVEFTYKGITTHLGVVSYAQWAPPQGFTAPDNQHKTDDKSKRSSAQVATPQSHVFEGRGQGKK